MIQIDGVVRVVPMKVSADSGDLQVEDIQEKAVVQNLFTANGVVQVVYPLSAIGGVIEVLQKAKKEADSSNSEIYVPQGGLSEADALAEAENAIRNPGK